MVDNGSGEGEEGGLSETGMATTKISKVRVSVRVRPLLPKELSLVRRSCIAAAFPQQVKTPLNLQYLSYSFQTTSLGHSHMLLAHKPTHFVVDTTAIDSNV